jgi:hypothetical protein
VRIIQTGDIHVCQSRTPTSNIIRTLNYIFYEKESLAETDLVIINGDFWDTLVTLPNDDALLARQWIRQFVAACAEHNVTIDVLEGTPDHDWKQSSEFVAFETTCNVRHITELSIVRHEHLDLNILYVPDEWKPTMEGIWQDVCHVLSEAKLDRVDVACVHGGFDFNFPPEYGIKSHSSERYSSIVKYACFANHIHTAKHHLKVHGPGSPDRLAQGEEGDKGYHRVTIDQKAETINIQWIKNPHAWTHKTIDVQGMDLDQIVQVTRETAKPLRAGSYLRLKNGEPLVVKAALITLRLEIKHVILEYKNKKQNGIMQNSGNQKANGARYTGVHISKTNATDVLVGWLRTKGLTNDAQLPLLEQTLRNAMASK